MLAFFLVVFFCLSSDLPARLCTVIRSCDAIVFCISRSPYAVPSLCINGDLGIFPGYMGEFPFCLGFDIRCK